MWEMHGRCVVMIHHGVPRLSENLRAPVSLSRNLGLIGGVVSYEARSEQQSVAHQGKGSQASEAVQQRPLGTVLSERRVFAETRRAPRNRYSSKLCPRAAAWYQLDEETSVVPGTCSGCSTWHLRDDSLMQEARLKLFRHLSQRNETVIHV